MTVGARYIVPLQYRRMAKNIHATAKTFRSAGRMATLRVKVFAQARSAYATQSIYNFVPHSGQKLLLDIFLAPQLLQQTASLTAFGNCFGKPIIWALLLPGATIG
jgi:hypothetical protein